jgi:ADP-ribose pyrophosphatase
MKHQRPRLLKHRVVYTGRVFQVEQDRVRLSNGRDATLDVVRHRGSVVLLPQPSRNELILIRQFRYVIGRWLWELPAGSIEAGERPAACARRECEEEIGFTPKRVERLGTFFPTPGFCDESMVFYRCTRLVKPTGPVELDVDEQIEPRVFTLSAVRALIAKGQIVDMKTVLGLGLVRPR